MFNESVPVLSAVIHSISLGFSQSFSINIIISSCSVDSYRPVPHLLFPYNLLGHTKILARKINGSLLVLEIWTIIVT